ncbi:sugar ABC transporter substrate-binding protein [Natronococcus pandeyae]|uniref:Sugar ABC transporter substrate-binding protein n=1 Tax=Natronococcus pandeyae TaxID=2055836 RepID=A0A8J8Q7Q1_9EURY|nr:substrate-binding domain-containing protein [Natronococcus pandeyae]TYL39194.1 sugar ABC transporter substrate-binding protein [Natronococcus pandeyae]
MSDRYSQGSDSSSSVSRRTFVKAAGAAGATVSLAGCIYGDDGDEDSVVIAMGSTTIDDVEDGMPDLLYENGLDEDIEIRFSSQSDDTGDQRDTYSQLIEAGETEPDLMMCDTGWTNVLVENGYLANLSEELDDETLSRIDEEYFEAFVDTARDPETDDLMALPLFPDYGCLYYNKNYARDAGYDDDDFEEWATEPMTWEEWAELTEEMVEASDAEVGLATQFDIYEGTSCCSFNEVMTSWGGAYFGGEENLGGPVGDRPVTIDEEEFIDALSMMYTFAADEDDDDTLDEYPTGIAPSDITSWDEEGAREPFSSGQTAMLRNWPYVVPTTLDDEADYPFEDEDDLGAMPIPYAVDEDEAAQPGAGGTASAQGGWHIGLNPNSERTEEAVEVMQAMTEDDFNLGMLEIVAWLPPKPELFDDEEATDPDAVGDIGHYMDTLRVAGENAMPRPVTEQWPSQAEIIAEQANRAVAGEASPEDAAADLQEALEQSES